jgi:hypothetical protein
LKKGQSAGHLPHCYVERISSLQQGSDFDDPGATLILRAIIERIEAACRSLELSVKGGVVFGNAAGDGLVARQLPVLETELSIIEVTLPFIIFATS